MWKITNYFLSIVEITFGTNGFLHDSLFNVHFSIFEMCLMLWAVCICFYTKSSDVRIEQRSLLTFVSVTHSKTVDSSRWTFKSEFTRQRQNVCGVSETLREMSKLTDENKLNVWRVLESNKERISTRRRRRSIYEYTTTSIVCRWFIRRKTN